MDPSLQRYQTDCRFLIAMKTSYIKIAYRNDGEWQTTTYRTDDPQWRETFLILRNSFQSVRILYT